MNKKLPFLALASICALSAAFANAKRAVKYYKQDTPGISNNWQLLTTTYDPSNCISSSTTYCVYTVSTTVTIPNLASRAQLIAVGGTGHNLGLRYVE
ncbi:hypothetical protein GA0116948_10146 [Chitinophaga costaii]|uniref:Secreted protein n=1 Tax=Chitinophaga costaii TaxID=1335309 RepID=A0A1C3YQF7_9BACT|nr:hypothetical protein GA0116948_10146 [Chitinophaga costaii]